MLCGDQDLAGRQDNCIRAKVEQDEHAVVDIGEGVLVLELLGPAEFARAKTKGLALLE